MFPRKPLSPLQEDVDLISALCHICQVYGYVAYPRISQTAPDTYL